MDEYDVSYLASCLEEARREIVLIMGFQRNNPKYASCHRDIAFDWITKVTKFLEKEEF